MEFRFVQKRDYAHNFYIERKINIFTKPFWFPFYKLKEFIIWYFIGVGLQLLFGFLFGFILHLFDSKVLVSHIVTSETYFICAWLFPLFNTLVTTKYAVNLIEWNQQFLIIIDKSHIFKKFIEKYSEFITQQQENQGVLINENNMFLVNKKTFWGKTKKIYYIGIKQLRKEKLEHLFS